MAPIPMPIGYPIGCGLTLICAVCGDRLGAGPARCRNPGVGPLSDPSIHHPVFASFARMSLSLSMRRSLAYRLREAGVTESAARDLARQPAPVPEDPDHAFDAPESD